MATVQLKRGVKSNLPSTGMLPGEPMVTTDKGTLFVAIDATTKIPVVPAVDALGAIGAVATDDLLLIQDTSTDMAKKISFADFKAALSIPAGSSDEKVAAVAGGTTGYIWGTDGTDGIIRAGASLNYSKDPTGGFVTLTVASIDGGTFV